MLHSETRATPVFRYNLQIEPDSYDPQRGASTVSSFVLNTLHSPLMQYNDGKLEARGATCAFMDGGVRRVRCQLRQDWVWSDGQPVVAQQIERAYRFLLKDKSPQLDQFLNVKAIFIKSDKVIEFELVEDDVDFLYRLVDPALSPRRDDIDMKGGRITSGPYVLSEIKPGRSLYFKPNGYDKLSGKQRPDIEALIVDSEHTALNLFDAKKINFLRRLTSDQVSAYKASPHYLEIPLHRFDYIGFGPSLAAYKHVRHNLIASLDEAFVQFQKIFDATGKPGCFGLHKSIAPKQYCFEQMKQQLEVEKMTAPLELYFALQGGDDIRRAMELFQAAWKSRARLEVQLRPLELGLLNARLKSDPPSLFRRGVPLDRPTCLAALEIFMSNGPDNYIRLSLPAYDKIVQKMRKARSQIVYDQLCLEGQKALIDAKRIIPLGQIHYAALSDGKFEGFHINILGQPDFSQLKSKETKTKVR